MKILITALTLPALATNKLSIIMMYIKQKTLYKQKLIDGICEYLYILFFTNIINSWSRKT